MAPNRPTIARTFEFDGGTTHADVYVKETFENKFGDERAILGGDTYEAKDIIKFDWDTTHHDFDGSTNDWIVDADALGTLARKLGKGGFSFSRDAPDADAGPLAGLAAAVSEGDHLTVTYHKKTDGETSEYAGTVYDARVRDDRVFVGFERDADGHRMYLTDDGDEPALYTSGSHHPFVGALARVEVGQ